ncbi:uncharacterized protein [Solanum lycopersicum]|uniref:uncharacterized protein n=1 Tax=Solanum lycopersicum TaxID=4081 RepID=UPI003747F6F0
MTTRTNVTGGRNEALPETVVEAPTSARGRAQAKGRTRGTKISRGHGRGEAPERGRAREGGGATATPHDSRTREGAQTQEHQQAPVFQEAQRGPIHASIPTFEGGQTSRGSYSPGQDSYASQQRPTVQGNYSGFSGYKQQFVGQRFCFTCGDPDHLMQQCTSQRGHVGPRPNPSFQNRPPAPQGRGRCRVQSGRGDRVSRSGIAAQHSRGRGTTQAGGGLGGHCYAFPERPEAESLDAVITDIIPVMPSTCVNVV